MTSGGHVTDRRWPWVEYWRSMKQYRLLGCLGLAILIVVGLGSKVYQGWAEAWVNDFSGDILYEIAWIWLIGIWKPCWSVGRISLGVFLVTCLIEITQLIPFSAALTVNLAWRLLLGTTFVWWDFPHYLLGSLLGYWSLRSLQKNTT